MNMKQATLIAIAALLLAGCNRVSLYNDLSETQANKMVAALMSAGIEARKEAAKDQATWTVSVQQDSIPHAMEVLAARGLPGAQFETLGDVFKKKGFVSSPLEEKARYLHGLSQELGRTLSAIDGVLSARVHIALPERDYLSEQSRPSSASVVLVIDPGADVVDRETDVKAIVKDSIEGLDDVNKVTVKYFTAPPVTTPPKAQAEPAVLATASVNPVVGAALLVAALFGGSIVWLSRMLRSKRAGHDDAR